MHHPAGFTHENPPFRGPEISNRPERVKRMGSSFLSDAALHHAACPQNMSFLQLTFKEYVCPIRAKNWSIGKIWDAKD